MQVEQHVFLSGKGGSGKTSVCAAWADLSLSRGNGGGFVLVDADVDAANLELLAGGQVQESNAFMGSGLAVIDSSCCDGCGRCIEVCRFAALRHPMQETVGIRDGMGVPEIIRYRCEGCGACLQVCPRNAIRLVPQRAGMWYRSTTELGPLFHARLDPGGENSGKLVATLRRKALARAEADGLTEILIDGSPGIGCPVISSITGATSIVAVTEASEAGRSDLARLQVLAAGFGIPIRVMINKADLNPTSAELIERACRDAGVPVLGRIPYDPAVVRSMVRGIPFTREGGAASEALRRIWEEVGRLPGSNHPVTS